VRRFGWIGVGSSALLVSVAAILMSQRPSARVELAGGGELRVLKVSLGRSHVFSTEPLWKKGLRRALPTSWQKPLGPFQGERFKTRDESLVIWVTGRTGTLGEPGVVFADGTVINGQIREGSRGVARLQFDSIPRGDREITFQVRAGSMFRFRVKNPHPAKARNWSAAPLPQTNQSSTASVILEEMHRDPRPWFSAEIEFTVKGYAQSPGTIGRVAWRITAFDPWGNRFPGQWAYEHNPKVTVPNWTGHTCKLLIEGQECLASGILEEPAPGVFEELQISPRAHALGLQCAIIVGPGSYRLDDEGVTHRASQFAGIPADPVLDLSRSGDSTNWVAVLESPFAGVFFLVEAETETPVTQARLRERSEPNGGLFSWPPAIEATSATAGRKYCARFVPARQPVARANLEGEILASIRTAEFYVSGPQR
jgi:hypothetical protein